MLSKNAKRIILIVIDIIVSGFIWYVNASWGNIPSMCLILSIITFLFIFIPFEVYWSFRDIWLDRWDKINLKNIKQEKIEIHVEDGKIIGALFQKSNGNMSDTSPIIIISPGFSDVKEDLEFFYLPLVNEGFLVLTYDARGTGESKKLGKRGDIKKRIKDFLEITKWIQKYEFLGNREIYAAGFSIGALTILCGGFHLQLIKKIYAISSIADYKKNIPRFNPIVWFRYFLKGIPQFPSQEINMVISPYHVINRFKEQNFSNSDQEWKKFSKKVMLVHVKNDKIVPFINFVKNRELLMLNDENTLVFEKGGHVLKKNELVLVNSALKFFKMKLLV